VLQAPPLAALLWNRSWAYSAEAAERVSNLFPAGLARGNFLHQPRVRPGIQAVEMHHQRGGDSAPAAIT
jgi:hypothetical protein